jgi:hypothetical protein
MRWESNSSNHHIIYVVLYLGPLGERSSPVMRMMFFTFLIGSIACLGPQDAESLTPDVREDHNLDRNLRAPRITCVTFLCTAASSIGS